MNMLSISIFKGYIVDYLSCENIILINCSGNQGVIQVSWSVIL